MVTHLRITSILRSVNVDCAPENFELKVVGRISVQGLMQGDISYSV